LGILLANFTSVDPDRIIGLFSSAALALVSGLKMDRLTLFGLFAVSSMLVCYAFENRGHWFVLGFAGACFLGSAYGFLQGAWPFGMVEGIWGIVAIRKWRLMEK
jgi:hypothetical protein